MSTEQIIERLRSELLAANTLLAAAEESWLQAGPNDADEFQAAALWHERIGKARGLRRALQIAEQWPNVEAE